MRSIPNEFYRTRAWIACREAYLRKHPLCEDCLQRGIYTPAKIVHHTIWLTEENFRDPAISLNHANLRAVCYSCHEREHKRERPRRYAVGADGHIAPRSD